MSPKSKARTVAVIGAGTMGCGIAQAAALAGWATAITDADPEALPAGFDRIRKTLQGGVDRGKITVEARDEALVRLRRATDVTDAAREADLVIEAVVEDLAVKQGVLGQAAAAAAEGALLASNTSSLSIAAIAGPLPHPERCLGLHFFNPVHTMRLVEVVVHDGIDAGTEREAVGIAEAMGKVPIVVRDSPGFASSRLGVALGLEAMRMLEEGVATADAIDTAMELGYNHPMGPLKLTDHVGLDVRLAIAEYLHQALDTSRFAPPDILRRLVAEGKLGKKSGEGFYQWKSE